MATVKIILRTSANNSVGLSPLRIRLTHNRKTKEITIPGVRVSKTDWIKEKGITKDNKMLNIRLNQIKRDYESVIDKHLFLGKRINFEEIIKTVRGDKTVLEEDSLLDNSSVIDYISTYRVTDRDLAFATRKNYKTLIYSLNKFNPRIKFNEVDGDTMNALEKFLLKSGLKANSVHTRLKCLKATLNKAYEDKKITRPDLRGFKLKRPIVSKDYLSLDDLKKLIDYLNRPNLDKYSKTVLDAFLWSSFSCGMRFGDVCRLTYQNLKFEDDTDLRLTYTMSKTNKRVSVILNGIAKQFIDERKVQSSQLVFDILSESTLYLEEDQFKAKIESKNAYINRRLKELCLSARIEKKVTFHMSRHSFCTNSLKLGIDHFTLKELAGLSLDVLETTYGKVVEESKTKALKKFDNLFEN